jgi:hypothetical protein
LQVSLEFWQVVIAKRNMEIRDLHKRSLVIRKAYYDARDVITY